MAFFICKVAHNPTAIIVAINTILIKEEKNTVADLIGGSFCIGACISCLL